jgi:DNA-binding CsgD family transcriptional regulator
VSPDTPADGPAVVLARWFRAFNDHDLDALVGLADPDIDVLPVAESASVPAGTSYHGHGGLRSIIGATYERFPAVQVSYELRTPHVGRRVTADLMFALDGDGSSRRAVCDYGIHAGHVHSIVTYDNEETRRAATRRGATLTTREREVLSLMASGRTVAEIAQQLHLSELTVRTHVRNAKDRLNARTTAHAIALAVEERALD